MSDDVTEFSWLDPNTVHLVGHGANGFPFLLAKAAAEEVAKVQKEERSRTQPERKKKVGKKKQLRAALAQAETALQKAGVDCNRGADPAMAEGILRQIGSAGSASQVAQLKKEAAEEAERAGRRADAQQLRRQAALVKMVARENARTRGELAHSRLGPGAVELFTRTGTLGGDPQVGGI